MEDIDDSNKHDCPSLIHSCAILDFLEITKAMESIKQSQNINILPEKISLKCSKSKNKEDGTDRYKDEINLYLSISLTVYSLLKDFPSLMEIFKDEEISLLPSNARQNLHHHETKTENKNKKIQKDIYLDDIEGGTVTAWMDVFHSEINDRIYYIPGGGISLLKGNVSIQAKSSNNISKKGGGKTKRNDESSQQGKENKEVDTFTSVHSKDSYGLCCPSFHFRHIFGIWIKTLVKRENEALNLKNNLKENQNNIKEKQKQKEQGKDWSRKYGQELYDFILKVLKLDLKSIVLYSERKIDVLDNIHHEIKEESTPEETRNIVDKNLVKKEVMKLLLFCLVEAYPTLFLYLPRLISIPVCNDTNKNSNRSESLQNEKSMTIFRKLCYQLIAKCLEVGAFHSGWKALAIFKNYYSPQSISRNSQIDMTSRKGTEKNIKIDTVPSATCLSTFSCLSKAPKLSISSSSIDANATSQKQEGILICGSILNGLQCHIEDYIKKRSLTTSKIFSIQNQIKKLQMPNSQIRENFPSKLSLEKTLSPREIHGDIRDIVAYTSACFSWIHYLTQIHYSDNEKNNNNKEKVSSSSNSQAFVYFEKLKKILSRGCALLDKNLQGNMNKYRIIHSDSESGHLEQKIKFDTLYLIHLRRLLACLDLNISNAPEINAETDFLHRSMSICKSTSIRLMIRQALRLGTQVDKISGLLVPNEPVTKDTRRINAKTSEKMDNMEPLGSLSRNLLLYFMDLQTACGFCLIPQRKEFLKSDMSEYNLFRKIHEKEREKSNMEKVKPHEMEDSIVTSYILSLVTSKSTVRETEERQHQQTGKNTEESDDAFFEFIEWIRMICFNFISFRENTEVDEQADENSEQLENQIVYILKMVRKSFIAIKDKLNFDNLAHIRLLVGFRYYSMNSLVILQRVVPVKDYSFYFIDSFLSMDDKVCTVPTKETRLKLFISSLFTDLMRKETTNFPYLQEFFSEDVISLKNHQRLWRQSSKVLQICLTQKDAEKDDCGQNSESFALTLRLNMFVYFLSVSLFNRLQWFHSKTDVNPKNEQSSKENPYEISVEQSNLTFLIFSVTSDTAAKVIESLQNRFEETLPQAKMNEKVDGEKTWKDCRDTQNSVSVNIMKRINTELVYCLDRLHLTHRKDIQFVGEKKKRYITTETEVKPSKGASTLDFFESLVFLASKLFEFSKIKDQAISTGIVSNSIKQANDGLRQTLCSSFLSAIKRITATWHSLTHRISSLNVGSGADVRVSLLTSKLFGMAKCTELLTQLAPIASNSPNKEALGWTSNNLENPYFSLSCELSSSFNSLIAARVELTIQETLLSKTEVKNNLDASQRSYFAPQTESLVSILMTVHHNETIFMLPLYMAWTELRQYEEQLHRTLLDTLNYILSKFSHNGDSRREIKGYGRKDAVNPDSAINYASVDEFVHDQKFQTILDIYQSYQKKFIATLPQNKIRMPSNEFHEYNQYAILIESIRVVSRMWMVVSDYNHKLESEGEEIDCNPHVLKDVCFNQIIATWNSLCSEKIDSLLCLQESCFIRMETEDAKFQPKFSFLSLPQLLLKTLSQVTKMLNVSSSLSGTVAYKNMNNGLAMSCFCLRAEILNRQYQLQLKVDENAVRNHEKSENMNQKLGKRKYHILEDIHDEISFALSALSDTFLSLNDVQESRKSKVSDGFSLPFILSLTLPFYATFLINYVLGSGPNWLATQTINLLLSISPAAFIKDKNAEESGKKEEYVFSSYHKEMERLWKIHFGTVYQYPSDSFEECTNISEKIVDTKSTALSYHTEGSVILHQLERADEYERKGQFQRLCTILKSLLGKSCTFNSRNKDNKSFCIPRSLIYENLDIAYLEREFECSIFLQAHADSCYTKSTLDVLAAGNDEDEDVIACLLYQIGAIIWCRDKSHLQYRHISTSNLSLNQNHRLELSVPETLNRIGTAYNKLGLRDKSLTYAERSLRMASTAGIWIQTVYSTLTMAEIHLKSKDLSTVEIILFPPEDVINSGEEGEEEEVIIVHEHTANTPVETAEKSTKASTKVNHIKSTYINLLPLFDFKKAHPYRSFDDYDGLINIKVGKDEKKFSHKLNGDLRISHGLFEDVKLIDILLLCNFFSQILGKFWFMKSEEEGEVDESYCCLQKSIKEYLYALHCASDLQRFFLDKRKEINCGWQNRQFRSEFSADSCSYLLQTDGNGSMDLNSRILTLKIASLRGLVECFTNLPSNHSLGDTLKGSLEFNRSEFYGKNELSQSKCDIDVSCILTYFRSELIKSLHSFPTNGQDMAMLTTFHSYLPLTDLLDSLVVLYSPPLSHTCCSKDDNTSFATNTNYTEHPKCDCYINYLRFLEALHLAESLEDPTSIRRCHQYLAYFGIQCRRMKIPGAVKVYHCLSSIGTIFDSTWQGALPEKVCTIETPEPIERLKDIQSIDSNVKTNEGNNSVQLKNKVNSALTLLTQSVFHLQDDEVKFEEYYRGSNSLLSSLFLCIQNWMENTFFEEKDIMNLPEFRNFPVISFSLCPQDSNALIVSIVNPASKLMTCRMFRGKANGKSLRPDFSVNSNHLDENLDEQFNLVDVLHMFEAIMEGNHTSLHGHKKEDIKKWGKKEKEAWWQEREILDSQLERMLQKLGLLINPLKDLIFLPTEEAERMSSVTASDLLIQGDCSTASKERPLFSVDNGFDTEISQRRNADIKGMTVNQLKVELTLHSLSTKGLKAALVSRLTKYYEDKTKAEHSQNSNQTCSNDVLELTEEKSSMITKDKIPAQTMEQSVFLLLDDKLQSLPWEMIPFFQKQGLSVYRIPSLSHFLSYKEQGLNSLKREVRFHGAKYVLDPEANLANTRTTLEPVIKDMEEKYAWKGIIGKVPSESEFKNMLLQTRKNNELFLFCGHGSGESFISRDAVSTLNRDLQFMIDENYTKPLKVEAVHPPSYGVSPEHNLVNLHSGCTVLMGCSSARLKSYGEFGGTGMIHSYLLGGMSTVVGNLWDVTDRDIDRFTIGFLSDIIRQREAAFNSASTKSSCHHSLSIPTRECDKSVTKKEPLNRKKLNRTNTRTKAAFYSQSIAEVEIFIDDDDDKLSKSMDENDKNSQNISFDNMRSGEEGNKKSQKNTGFLSDKSALYQHEKRNSEIVKKAPQDIASIINEARKNCKLKYLVGAAVVTYGFPCTFNTIVKKDEENIVAPTESIPSKKRR